MVILVPLGRHRLRLTAKSAVNRAKVYRIVAIGWLGHSLLSIARGHLEMSAVAEGQWVKSLLCEVRSHATVVALVRISDMAGSTPRCFPLPLLAT